MDEREKKEIFKIVINKLKERWPDSCNIGLWLLFLDLYSQKDIEEILNNVYEEKYEEK